MKRKCAAAVLILFLLAGCCKKYNFANDKKIIPDKTAVENSDKFELTIYYNSPHVYQEPLSIYEIRDGCFEKKNVSSLYRHVFMDFFSQFFPQKIREVRNTEKSTVFVTTLCEMKNADGELVFWYSYETEDEKYMILNGKVFARNKMLMEFTQSLIEHSDVIVPE